MKSSVSLHANQGWFSLTAYGERLRIGSCCTEISKTLKLMSCKCEVRFDSNKSDVNVQVRAAWCNWLAWVYSVPDKSSGCCCFVDECPSFRQWKHMKWQGAKLLLFLCPSLPCSFLAFVPSTAVTAIQRSNCSCSSSAASPQQSNALLVPAVSVFRVDPSTHSGCAPVARRGY